VGIDRRVAPIRSDQVVQVMLLAAPFPGGDDHVALNALRPRWLRERQLAPGDSIGPFSVYLYGTAAKLPASCVVICSPDWPAWSRRIQASSELADLNASGMVRVDACPS
jgi:hypothetical protein